MLDGAPLEGVMLAVEQDGISVGESKPVTASQSMPGRHGDIDLTLADEMGAAYAGSREISVNVFTYGAEDDITHAKQWLGALNGKRTSFRYRDLPGEWRGRLSVGEWSDTWAMDRLILAKTTFTIQADPLLYGPRRVRSLVEGRTVFAVRGNRPAWPVFTLTPKSGARTLAVGDGTHAVTLPDVGSAYSGSVVVDCAAHAVRVNGNLSRITLDSDYFPLLPKLAAITCTNCSGSLSYEPLTLI